MIVGLQTLLREARRRSRAVGSFNVYNLETIKGVLAAAAAEKAPVVVAFGAGYLKNMDLEEVAAAVRRGAERISVDLALHLDHCRDLGVIEQAVAAGFSSVMFDGSALPFAENVERTAAAVGIAAAKRISVEGELGSLSAGLATNEGGAEDVERYTDPEAAAEFVRATGVDALAVSIGTVHGFYKGKPDIRLDVLRAIRAKVEAPLVLHGGSDTPEDTIRACIAGGICKINVNTEISFNAVAAIAQAITADKHTHLSQVSLRQVESVEKTVRGFINLFSGDMA